MSFAGGYRLGTDPSEENGGWELEDAGYAFAGYEDGEAVIERLREGDDRQPPRRHLHPRRCRQYPLPAAHHLREVELCLGDQDFGFASEPCGQAGAGYLPGEDGSLRAEEGEYDVFGGPGSTLSLPERKRTRSSSSRHRCETVTELGPEEVRWFYREDRKAWKPFIGYDSLRIELAHRQLCERSAPPAEGAAGEGGGLTLDVEAIEVLRVEPVCVRSGLYEVDVAAAECYPVYWNRGGGGRDTTD